MALQYGITLTELAEADSDITQLDSTVVPTLTPPDNEQSWKLQYSLRGEYKMYHFWVNGSRENGGGVETYWTGREDAIGDIGMGSPLVLTTQVGQPIATKTIMLDHRYPVSIYGGQACWQNAGNLTDNNAICIEVLASATQLQTAANLDLALDGEKIYYAGAGAGTHGFAATPTLVENYDKTGYWNYVDGNVLPAAGDGEYDMYTADKTVSRFINHIVVFGDNPIYKEIQSSNTWTIPPVGYSIVIKLHNNSDTVWSAAFILNLIRKSTVDF